MTRRKLKGIVAPFAYAAALDKDVGVPDASEVQEVPRPKLLVEARQNGPRHGEHSGRGLSPWVGPAPDSGPSTRSLAGWTRGMNWRVRRLVPQDLAPGPPAPALLRLNSRLTKFPNRVWRRHKAKWHLPR